MWPAGTEFGVGAGLLVAGRDCGSTWLLVRVGPDGTCLLLIEAGKLLGSVVALFLTGVVMLAVFGTLVLLLAVLGTLWLLLLAVLGTLWLFLRTLLLLAVLGTLLLAVLGTLWLLLLAVLGTLPLELVVGGEGGGRILVRGESFPSSLRLYETTALPLTAFFISTRSLAVFPSIFPSFFNSFFSFVFSSDFPTPFFSPTAESVFLYVPFSSSLRGCTEKEIKKGRKRKQL